MLYNTLSQPYVSDSVRARSFELSPVFTDGPTIIFPVSKTQISCRASTCGLVEEHLGELKLGFLFKTKKITKDLSVASVRQEAGGRH